VTGSDPLGSVVITARDIYDALIRLQEAVSRLVDQSVGHADDIRDHETRLRTVEDVRPAPRIKELEERMRAVEARQWPLPAASLLIAVASLGVALLPRIVN